MPCFAGQTPVRIVAVSYTHLLRGFAPGILSNPVAARSEIAVNGSMPMIRPDGLKQSGHLEWSPGTGDDVWQIFCACIAGDLDAVRSLVAKDPSLCLLYTSRCV